MGLIENLSDRWLKYFNSSNPKAELIKMTKQDYIIYNKFKTSEERNKYLENNAKDLHKMALSMASGVKVNPNDEKARKLITNTQKLKNIIDQLFHKIKNSFLGFLYTCLAISILAILTLMLMNRKLDKFIRITSDFFYATKEAIKDTFYKSLGALMTLSVTDFLEEFTKCMDDYLTTVKKLISLVRREDLDKPITVLLASIGLMSVAVVWQYYKLYKDANGAAFDPYKGDA